MGGTLTGLLFENQRSGYPLQLTWTFTIDCADVVRDFGRSPTNVVIDWVPSSREVAWNELSGMRVACSSFREPVETSVYFFEHHRYDRVELEVLEQRGAEVAIRVSASGDIDSLGIPEISVDANIIFAGISVQTGPTGTDPAGAAELLRRFTDISGLRARPRGHNVLFELAG